MLKCNTMWSWIHLVVSVYYLEDRPKTMTALTGMLLSLCTTSNFCASIYQILSTKLISLRLNRKRSYATTFFIKIGPWSGPGLALVMALCRKEMSTKQWWIIFPVLYLLNSSLAYVSNCFLRYPNTMGPELPGASMYSIVFFSIHLSRNTYWGNYICLGPNKSSMTPCKFYLLLLFKRQLISSYFSHLRW